MDDVDMAALGCRARRYVVAEVESEIEKARANHRSPKWPRGTIYNVLRCSITLENAGTPIEVSDYEVMLRQAQRRIREAIGAYVVPRVLW